MESKHIMELVDRIVLLAEENARLRAEMTALKGLLDEAELKEVEYCLDSGAYFRPRLDVSLIRRVMDWDISPEVKEQMLQMRKEKKDAEG